MSINGVGYLLYTCVSVCVCVFFDCNLERHTLSDSWFLPEFNKFWRTLSGCLIILNVAYSFFIGYENFLNPTEEQGFF